MSLIDGTCFFLKRIYEWEHKAIRNIQIIVYCTKMDKADWKVNEKTVRNMTVKKVKMCNWRERTEGQNCISKEIITKNFQN